MKKILPILFLASTTALAVPPHAEEANEKIEGVAMTPDPLPVTPPKPRLPRHCAIYEDMTKRLAEKYGEHLVFSGINKDKRTMRNIFVNAMTGSHTTTTVTHKKDFGIVACVISSGTGGQVHDAVKPHTVRLSPK